MIKVMTFNIRMGLANDGMNHWRYRKSLALGRINAFKPDLLGIQECYDDEAQAGFLQQHLAGYEFYGVQRGGHLCGERCLLRYHAGLRWHHVCALLGNQPLPQRLLRSSHRDL